MSHRGGYSHPQTKASRDCIDHAGPSGPDQNSTGTSRAKWHKSDTSNSLYVPAGENENPGALAGATGADYEAGCFKEKEYSSAPEGATVEGRPLTGDWNRSRWDWHRAMMGDTTLNATAKNLGTVIVTQAADCSSGECWWHNDRFAEALGVTVSTVKRAFKALAEAGWLVRTDGRGRGNHATLIYLMPGNLVPISAAAARPKNRQTAPEKRSATATFSTERRAPRDLTRAPKTVQRCTKKGAVLRFPPTPPYKDSPNNLQRARAGDDGRPRPDLRAVASPGSWQFNDWNDWLKAHGFPSLSSLGIRSSNAQNAGFDVPYRTPPRPEDSTEERIAVKWAAWARGHMEARYVAV